MFLRLGEKGEGRLPFVCLAVPETCCEAASQPASHPTAAAELPVVVRAYKKLLRWLKTVVGKLGQAILFFAIIIIIASSNSVTKY